MKTVDRITGRVHSDSVTGIKWRATHPLLFLVSVMSDK